VITDFRHPEKSTDQILRSENEQIVDHLCPNQSLGKALSGDQNGDQMGDHRPILGDQRATLPTLESISPNNTTEYDHRSVPLEHSVPTTTAKLPTPIEVEIQGAGGKSKGVLIVTKVHSTGKAFKVECELPDGTTKTLHQRQKLTGTKQQAEEIAREILTKWQAEVLENKRFKVRQLGVEDYIWVEGCKIISFPNPLVKTYYLFLTPSGDRITVAGDDEFEMT
jgi:hypothetical protein